MSQVVVYGAGGMGKEVAEAVIAAACDGRSGALLGFIDDQPTLAGKEVMGYPVLGSSQWVAQHPDTEVVLGLGHPWQRHVAANRLAAAGARFASIIDPRAQISAWATLGKGVVIFAGSVISSGAALGDLVYLNYNSVISHDARLGSHACIMGQVAVSGNVHVGAGAFLGVGVSTRQGVNIGEWSLVGAGAAVVTDIPPLCVAYGVPARVIRHYESPDQMPPF